MTMVCRHPPGGGVGLPGLKGGTALECPPEWYDCEQRDEFRADVQFIFDEKIDLS